MKISIDYNKHFSDRINIVSARYLGDFAMRIFFSDGTEKVVDFKPFLSKSIHPSIKKYHDENKFSRFAIVDGNINWNDFVLYFLFGIYIMEK